MDHGKFQSKIFEIYNKIIEIYNLIQNNCTTDKLADFIDQQSQGLKEYLARNEDWSHFGYVAHDPLSVAAWRERDDILRLLLSKYDMAVNARCTRGTRWSTTPLTWAIARNKVDCVKILLQHGASPDVGGICYDTPFKNATELDRLCKAGLMDNFGVSSRDDSIKNLLEEEEAARRKGGERERAEKEEGNNKLPG